MPSRRMSKRPSLNPRLSIIMAGDAGESGERKISCRDFCANHMKTIVTIIMIFGTILCIVLIVMVHKSRFDNDKLEQVETCLDVAIVGAGISGTYAAWKLRHDQHKIEVFEVSDRVGGRLYTHYMPDLPGLNAELGALYYLPQQHPLLNQTIHALKLTPSELRPPSRDPPTYYLRGRQLRTSELNAINSNRLPYFLKSGEEHKRPEELRQLLINQAVLNKSLLQLDPLMAKTKDGLHLYKQGFLNVLGEYASQEGLNFLSDAVPWRSLMSNGNAALLSSTRHNPYQRQMTVQEGMGSIPQALIDGFLDVNITRHGLQYNRRLACVHKDGNLYIMTFVKTYTENGITMDTKDVEERCARKIILALPPHALAQIQWKGFTDESYIRDGLKTVDPVPALAVYFAYNKTWWTGKRPPMQYVITDLPNRVVRYLGARKTVFPSDKLEVTKHLFLVGLVDGPDVDYFRALVDTPALHDGILRVTCAQGVRLVRHIHRFLSQIFLEKDIPEPCSMMLLDWGETHSGAGWYFWKKGVHWKKMAERMRKPFPRKNIYVVGSSFCDGNCQLWIEGALQTVEDVLRTYFL